MRFAVSKRRDVATARGRGTRAGFLAAGLALALAAAPAAAQTFAALPSVPSTAEPTGAAKPIAAWVTFCQAYGAECAVDRNEPARISLTPALWSTIVAVNKRVNKSVRAMTDQDHLGTPDRWDLAEDGIGDCEDFQLLKRHLLAAAGLPKRAMRMTVVIDEKGEGHAVLTLITDRGDLVLDNKTSQILPWHRTGYVFVKRESQDATAWVSLGGVSSPVTTANR
ncbi:transglutaminase-like cysteine peptidase [Methylobacterium radiodurans]|uniref:Transglutaminase n=1 Tax=Methylobacterium radiodurans TaxID=2202828 RepID=A0A2U8VMD8_9HYPH|nr:transglutaminase-like cysteine peptidase [Methylobacterium radiodurans]AWN34839.1 transglutaminase [Methylobacterium radiodurans]